MATPIDFSKICMNCGENFTVVKKTYRRTSLETQINENATPVSIISTIKPDLVLTPLGKYLCRPSTALLGKIQSGQDKLEKVTSSFLEAGYDKCTYMKSKLDKIRTPKKTPVRYQTLTPKPKRLQQGTPKKKLKSQQARFQSFGQSMKRILFIYLLYQ